MTAKIGRPPSTDRALKLRGSRLSKHREAKKNQPKKAAPVDTRPRRPISNIRELIRILPGYDPYRDAVGCKFDEQAARAAIMWIETECVHVKGSLAGQPFLLEDWQRAIVANLFGWKRADGTRRYREAFIMVARKNGKTPMIAAILTLLLFEDGEPGSEIYGAASEYQQASLVFAHAAGMVRHNKSLAERCRIYTGQAKAIQLLEDFSTYRVISREASSSHGFNTHAYAIDEVHCLPDGELLETMETSTGARRQPLALLITTSDYEREGSPCNAKHDYAKAVCEGRIPNPAFLPVIYEAAREDDFTDPEVWKKANPNLGISVSLDYLQSACQKAQDTPAFENTFKRLHLNIRTQQDVVWLPMDKWDACAGRPLDIEEYIDRECWAGLDLAATSDMNAFVMVFPETDGTIALIPRFWVPREAIEQREKDHKAPYTQWMREGWIIPTEGRTTDYSAIRRDINALAKEQRIRFREIPMDRLFQGDQLGKELAEQDGFEVVAHGQGFMSMAAPTKRFEEMVLSGQIRHGGHPVLRWHAGNVAVELDAAGNMKPSRKKSKGKIDGMVAGIMAVGRAVVRSSPSATVHTIDLGGGQPIERTRAQWEDDDDD